MKKDSCPFVHDKDRARNNGFMGMDSVSEWIKVALLFFLLICMGYFLVVKADFDRYFMLKKQGLARRTVLKLKQKEIVSHNESRNKLKSMSEPFTNKQHAPWMLEIVSKTAKSCGLSIDSFTTLPEVEQAAFTELPIDMSVIGTYQQITLFLSRVAKMSQLVTWHDFIVTRDKSSDLLFMKIRAKLYRYRQKKTSSSVEVVIPRNERRRPANDGNPFIHAPITVHEESLDAIHFIGVLKQGSKVWAVIIQSNGLVSTVKEGDFIGEERGQVIRINDGIIEVEKIIKRNGKLDKQLIKFNLRQAD